MTTEYCDLINEINIILEKQAKLTKDLKEIKKKLYYKDYYRSKLHVKDIKIIHKTTMHSFD